MVPLLLLECPIAGWGCVTRKAQVQLYEYIEMEPRVALGASIGRGLVRGSFRRGATPSIS
jgi:hypothetical protein